MNAILIECIKSEKGFESRVCVFFPDRGNDFKICFNSMPEYTYLIAMNKAVE